MADAVRSAKLKLTIDSADGLLGLDDLLRAGEKIERQEQDIRSEAEKTNAVLKERAEAATKGGASGAAASTIERYGAEDLSRVEIKRQRAAERAAERKMERETRQEIADERAAREFSRKAMEDARKRRSAADEKAKRDASEYAEFKDDFEGEQFRLQQDEAQTARKNAEKAYADYVKHAKENAKLWEKYWSEQRAAMERADEVRGANFKERIRGGLHDRGLIDARSDYQRRRDAEGQSGLGAMANSGLGMLGMAGGYAFLAHKAAEIGTTAGGAVRNRDITDRQRQTQILDTIPLSATLRNFVQSIEGTTERIRRANQRLHEDDQRLTALMQGRQQSQDATMGWANAYARSSVMSRASAGPLQTFDRGSLSGQIGYEEYQRRLPGQDESASADREVSISRAQQRAAAAQLSIIERDYQAAVRRRERADQTNRNVRANDSNDGSRQEALSELNAAEARERALFEQRIQYRRQLEQAGVSAAQAEARAREVNIRQMQTELEILRTREQRASSAAERLGSMGAMDRQRGSAAVRAIQERGIQNVTPEVRQMASSYAPEWFQTQSRQFGETTAEYQRDRQVLAPGSGTIAGDREQQDRLQQQIREETIDNQSRLAEQISETLGQTFEAVIGALQERMDRIERDVRRGRQLGTANQN